MGPERPLTARYARPLYKAAVNTSALSVTACLTYPVADHAADYVVPDGGDWNPHAARPWVGLEHLRYARGSTDEVGYPNAPGISERPVVCGWARESLSEPGAPHAVELRTVKIQGKSHRLPFGTTYFDPDDAISAQVFALIEQDVLPGVSLEFTAAPGHPPAVLKARSPLENRPAWRFDRWSALAYVHCAQPVNPGALTLTKSLDPLRSILSAGRIGSEVLHPVILKSLAAYAPTLNRRAVRSPGFEAKAMDEEAMAGDAGSGNTVYDDAAAEAGLDEPAGEVATPTAQAAYDLAQILTDTCGHMREALKQGEHVQGRKAILALCDKLEGFAEKATATGDKITADVGGDAEFAEEGDDEDEPEVDAEEMEPDDEDDGVMKAFRHPKRKVYRKAVKRFRMSDFVRDEGTTDCDSDGDSPEDLARLEKAKQRYARAERIYGF